MIAPMDWPEALAWIALFLSMPLSLYLVLRSERDK